MSFAAFRAVVGRELAFLWASPVEQALWIWSPLMAVALILWLFSAGLPEGLPISVLDQDHSASSRELIRRLGATRSLRVGVLAESLPEALGQARSREAYAIVQIPQGWEAERLRGGQKPVVLYNNAQYYLPAGLITAAVRDSVASLAGEQAVLREARFGGGLVAAGQRMGAVRAELRTLFDPQISYELYLGGMLTPILLHIYLVVMVVSAVGREFRDRTVEQWLASAKGCLLSALVGKCLPAVCLHLCVGGVLMGMLMGFTGGHVAGSLVLWLLAMAGFVLVSTALGVFLISLTGNLRIGLSLAGLLVATAPAFSGFTFPLDAMSNGARHWGELMPLTYYLKLQQGQWMSGASLQAWGQGILRLAGFGMFFMLVGWIMLRRQIANPARWGRR
ncbi:ABC transporter permease [Uliginosibacterium gangwonense]|uniref:ABC transporter permease n=1 Tax=Uliginosibacterium gangwonense TaxID=392736 RepID=UPI00037A4275|nr:ABC transporter permease [Uliginosibacterium gangwonense]